MTLKEAMKRLEAKGDAKMREYHRKNGAGDNLFGLKMGDIRVVAKEIKTDPALAAELWKTGNLEAMLLATLVTKAETISASELDRMVRAVNYSWLADWLMSYVVRLHPDREKLRVKWMASDHPSALRAGWSLTAQRVAKEPEGLDIEALLDRIEKEMGGAHALPQWAMNSCLAEVGINHPKHRKRAVAIGEKLGVYRDYPVSKGCTSPFAPIWIAALTKGK